MAQNSSPTATKILVAGSLNVDEVYQVSHIVKPGETISSTECHIFAGGKGANQAAALGRAGACVSFFGRCGQDGDWIVHKLREDYHVNTMHLQVSAHKKTGKAIIQVTPEGENAIILFPGENQCISEQDFQAFPFHDFNVILLQNEISNGPLAMSLAAKAGLEIVWNPSPCHQDILKEFDMHLVNVLIVNQGELESLYHQLYAKSPLDIQDAIKVLLASFSSLKVIVVTLGAQGLVCGEKRQHDIHITTLPALSHIQVVDTTGAGDTFLGYFLAEYVKGSLATALKMGISASGLACQSPGAMTSIPTLEQVLYKLE